MFYQFEKINYDYTNGIILKDNKEIKLTNTQKKLLNYLLDNPKIIQSKQKLMEQVWGRIITENSINQFISVLRNHIEVNPTKPKFIITHFGKGISFEGDLKAGKEKTTPAKIELPKPNYLNRAKYIIFSLLLLIVLGWFATSYFFQPVDSIKSLKKNQKILVLPTVFEDNSTSSIQRKGMESLLALNFNNLETEGQVVIDKTSHDAQQALEKYWQADKDIVVMSSNVVKKGDMYEVVLELSNQSGSVDKKVLLAKNISNILENKIGYINTIQNDKPLKAMKIVDHFSANDLFIEALGYKNIGDLDNAKQLIEQVLQKQGDFYQARLVLAEILFQEKNFDQSLAQFNTLKSTGANQIIGTEIQLGLARIKQVKHEFKELIADLTTYQNNNLFISEVKKSKIKLQIADAYNTSGDLENAMMFYQDSVSNVNEQLNPELYAQSYYGQGKVLLSKSNDQNVYALFEKSLTYAKLAGNIHQQILALNSMSRMLISSYDWDKGIDLKKQALALMESVNDRNEIALGLGTLVAILNQSGYFTEAKAVNEKLGEIAKELKSDLSIMHYLHYGAVLSMNAFEFDYAQQQIDSQLKLAIKTDNYVMQLDNAFLVFELILLKKDAPSFKPEWDKRSALIKQKGFERFDVYMDYFLARYYKLINKDKEAIALLNDVAKVLKKTNDIKVLVDTQIQLAEVYLKTNPEKSLEILNNLVQYDPQPNPYLEVKAKAFNKLNNNIEALSLMNQAKLNYNESWTAENQTLLESIEESLKQ